MPCLPAQLRVAAHLEKAAFVFAAIVLASTMAVPARALAGCGDMPGDAQALAEARAQVEAVCPCAAAPSRRDYVRCASSVTEARTREGRLRSACGHAARRCALRSTCGQPDRVVCCRTVLGRSTCRRSRNEARCVARGGTVHAVASCCDACVPGAAVAFVDGACPSRFAPPGCPQDTKPTCHEAFVADASATRCATGHGAFATYFTPEDDSADAATSRAWSFAIRPMRRVFQGNYREITGSLRFVSDGAGAAGSRGGATDEAHLRLTAPGRGGLLFVLRWFTAGLPPGSAASLRVAKGAETIVEVSESPGGPVERLRTGMLTWDGSVDLTVSASLTGARSAMVPTADLLWHLALLDLTKDDDHDGVVNQADPHPLDRTVPARPAPSQRPKVLVVGLDGAGWDVLDPLMGAGYLPRIAGVVGGGSRAFLDETPATPRFCCYCPPVWSSLATGQPAAQHGMHSHLHEPWDRLVPAVWTVLARHGGTSTHAAFRNTWPPEPGTTYNVTEPGISHAAQGLFDSWPFVVEDDLRSELANRLQSFWPPDLLESFGLLPYDGPRPPVWAPMAWDRASAAVVAAIAERDQTDLTMCLLHSPDKSEHLTWCSVQPVVGEPFDVAQLLREAAAWTGPVEGALWAYGTVASQNLEADLHLGTLLDRARYDYVVLASDHAMTHSGVEGSFCGNHGTPPAFHGIFALAGPGVKPGVDLGTISLLDVAPTLAYILDLPVGENLPGRVVVEAFTPEHLASHPVRTVASW